MRSLYIDLHDCVTLEGGTINDDESNLPFILPVVSTTSDPLSQCDSDDTDNDDDDEYSCPLHRGGYKFVGYDICDEHVSKKCKLSNRY